MVLYSPSDNKWWENAKLFQHSGCHNANNIQEQIKMLRWAFWMRPWRLIVSHFGEYLGNTLNARWIAHSKFFCVLLIFRWRSHDSIFESREMSVEMFTYTVSIPFQYFKKNRELLAFHIREVLLPLSRQKFPCLCLGFFHDEAIVIDCLCLDLFFN